jgi:hypothetical protein
MAHMYLLTAALVIAGWLAVFISLRRTLKRTCADLRLEFQRQIDSLSASVRALEQAADTRGTAVSAVSSPGEAQAPEEITPETLATIAETIAALLGRKVHLRSVKILPTPDAIANPWAQHGRAVVQASHNFSQRKREP